VTNLGLTFGRDTQSATADFDALADRASRRYSRIASPCLQLSAFGRGLASAAYGVSSLLYAGEFVEMPTRTLVAFSWSTAALVDRAVNPVEAPPKNDNSQSQRFAGIPQQLMTAPPSMGGLGALPLAEHLTAQKAKWSLKLLFGSTRTPWIRLAWTLISLWVRCVSPVISNLLHISLCRGDPITNPGRLVTVTRPDLG